MGDKELLFVPSGGVPDRRLIDVHCHPLTPRYHRLVAEVAAAGVDDRFPYHCFLPARLPAWSEQQAIETMDRRNARAQVLSLPDATVELRGDFARRIARETNEMLAGIVARHPGRFAALGVLPHDDPDSSLAELAYALEVLKLDGIATTTNIRGTYLGDPSFDPWLEELHRRNAVLFVHPTVSASIVTAAPLFIEFSFDSSKMVMHMVLTGAKKKYDGIKLISTHGGGTIPFISARLEELAPVLMPGSMTSEEIATGLRSFYYDLTSCMADAPLAAATTFSPASRLLLGSDIPFLPEEMMERAVQRFSRFLGVGQEEKDEMRHANALTLFPRLQK